MRASRLRRLEQIAGCQHPGGIELTLHRAHHTELHRRELQGKPTSLELSDAMLGGDRAAARDDVMQCVFDDLLDARELGGVASNEILVRMSVAGVTVNHRLLDARAGGKASRFGNGVSEPSIRYCPIRGYLPA